MLRLSGAMLAAFLLLLTPVAAEDAALSIGGDQYAAGQSPRVSAPVANDAFLAGYDVSLGAAVTGDAHLGGFNVAVTAPVTGNVYAGGFSVNISATTGKDVTAIGNSVTLGASANVGGNVRLAGATISIAAPIAGAALVSGQSVTLDAPVTGDFSFIGDTLTFGPNARVDGLVILQGPKPIDVPLSVAPADRVSFSVLTAPDYARETAQTATHAVQGTGAIIWAAAMWTLVLIIVGAGSIALLPRQVAALETASTHGVWRLLGLGILGFATTLGLIPVLAMTVIGLVLVPFALLFAFVASVLAYLGGAYLAGRRLASGFVAADTNLKRLAVLVVAIVVAALLGSIPMLGWLITMLLLLYGFGAASRAILARDANRALPAS